MSIELTKLPRSESSNVQILRKEPSRWLSESIKVESIATVIFLLGIIALIGYVVFRVATSVSGVPSDIGMI